jgi:hypothetical protein
MLIAAVLLSALVQDQVENPEYKGWKPFKPGSWVTYKFVREGTAQSGEQKTTLKSIDDNEAVLETDFVLGGKSAGKPMERKVPAKLAAAQVPQMSKEGEEEIEVGGKTLKCKTRDYERLAGGKPGSLRYWIHEDIPGMVAKVETTAAGSKITMIASSWEKK